MTITLDMRDRIKLRARNRRIAKYIKTGVKVAFYGYIGTRLVMGGLDAIIAYGKTTAIFKGIDIVAAKIFG